jgi:hypothetical protein
LFAHIKNGNKNPLISATKLPNIIEFQKE